MKRVSVALPPASTADSAEGGGLEVGPLTGSDPSPRFSHRLLRWFARYLSFYFGRHFNAVRVAKTGPDPAGLRQPLILYSNHPSWWDPILFMLVGHALFPGREGYGPMDAQALEKYPILRRLGVFGVERGSRRGAVSFLRVGMAVLRRPQATFWITAEGAFTDARQRPLHLRSGLARLARRVPEAAVVPLALEYTFWNERLPEALLRFGEPVQVRDLVGVSVAESTRHLERRLEATMDALAVESQARDPEAFATLLLGRSGVGGPYDTWRRLRATVAGRPFEAAHGARRP